MKFNPFKPRAERAKGASLVEYGLLAGLVSVVAISAVAGTGTEVKSVFSNATAGVGTGMSVAADAGAAGAPETPPAGTMSFSMTIGNSGTTVYGYGSIGSISDLVNTTGATLNSFYYYEPDNVTHFVLDDPAAAEDISMSATIICDGYDAASPYYAQYVPSQSRGYYRFAGDPFQLQGNTNETRQCAYTQ